MIVERRVVDNRVLLLGLDKLYRDAMKQHERGELLMCARRVAEILHEPPADVPVEGYYAEEAALTEYFRLARALQDVDEGAMPSVDSVPEFQRLLAVTSAPIFGVPQFAGKLLPTGRDPLSQALLELRPWTLGGLTAAAYEIARTTDDISLVGLAARVRDAVVLTATRESVVLYAEVMTGCARMVERRDPEYVWNVDDELAHQARRFVDTFNRLLGTGLPAPEPAQADAYWQASEDNVIRGRCVRLGYDDTVSPIRHYHWAICPGAGGELVVEEFWKGEVWTTERYRAVLDERMISRFRERERPQSSPPERRPWWKFWDREGAR
jgi:hypothetical protein